MNLFGDSVSGHCRYHHQDPGIAVVLACSCACCEWFPFLISFHFFVSGVGCNFGSVANKDPETNNATGCGSLWTTNGAILSSGTTCTVACISGYSSAVSDVYCDGATLKASSASGSVLPSPSWWDCAGAMFKLFLSLSLCVCV